MSLESFGYNNLIRHRYFWTLIRLYVYMLLSHQGCNSSCLLSAFYRHNRKSRKAESLTSSLGPFWHTLSIASNNNDPELYQALPSYKKSPEMTKKKGQGSRQTWVKYSGTPIVNFPCRNETEQICAGNSLFRKYTTSSHFMQIWRYDSISCSPPSQFSDFSEVRSNSVSRQLKGEECGLRTQAALGNS